MPPDSGSSPAMQLSAVDLPQPDGPSSAMNSPRRIVSVSSSSAANARRRAGEAARDAIEPKLVEIVLHATASACELRCDARAPRGGSIGMRCVTSSSARRPAGPRCGTPRPAPSASSDCVCGNCGEPLVVLGPAELLDRVLAFLRRHRQRHVLHRRARDRSSPCRRCSACASGVSRYAIRSSTTASFSGGDALRHRPCSARR